MSAALRNTRYGVLEALLVTALLWVAVFGLIPLISGVASPGLAPGGSAFWGAPVHDVVPSITVEIPPEVAEQPGGDFVPAYAGTTAPYTARMFFTNGLDGWHSAAYLSLPVFKSVLAVAVILLLWRIVRSTRSGEIFSAANVRRMTGIWVLVVAGGMALQLLDLWVRYELLAPTALPLATSLSLADISFAPVVVGSLLAFFTEVFRRGVALRDEVEGVV